MLSTKVIDYRIDIIKCIHIIIIDFSISNLNIEEINNILCQLIDNHELYDINKDSINQIVDCIGHLIGYLLSLLNSDINLNINIKNNLDNNKDISIIEYYIFLFKHIKQLNEKRKPKNRAIFDATNLKILNLLYNYIIIYPEDTSFHYNLFTHVISTNENIEVQSMCFSILSKLLSKTKNFVYIYLENVNNNIVEPFKINLNYIIKNKPSVK